MDGWEENKNMKKQMDGWLDGQEKIERWLDGYKN